MPNYSKSPIRFDEQPVSAQFQFDYDEIQRLQSEIGLDLISLCEDMNTIETRKKSEEKENG